MYETNKQTNEIHLKSRCMRSNFNLLGLTQTWWIICVWHKYETLQTWRTDLPWSSEGQGQIWSYPKLAPIWYITIYKLVTACLNRQHTFFKNMQPCLQAFSAGMGEKDTLYTGFVRSWKTWKSHGTWKKYFQAWRSHRKLEICQKSWKIK